MYAKLFTSIYQGTLRGDSHGLLVFTNLLAHADIDGSVDIHPRAIAEEVGLSIDQVKAALVVLEAPDPESRSPEADGRRIIRMDDHRAWGWNIVNHAKYNAIRSIEDRREQNRRAQAAWRLKQANADSKQSSAAHKRDKPSKPPSAHIDIDKDIDTRKTNTARERAAPARVPPCPDGVTDVTWGDWLTLRKAKRAPVTETVVREAAREAVKAGLSLETFLRVWCSRGSQGLQADWLRPHERASPKDAISKYIKGTSLDPDFQGYTDDDGDQNGNVPALR